MALFEVSKKLPFPLFPPVSESVDVYICHCAHCFSKGSPMMGPLLSALGRGYIVGKGSEIT